MHVYGSIPRTTTFVSEIIAVVLGCILPPTCDAHFFILFLTLKTWSFALGMGVYILERSAAKLAKNSLDLQTIQESRRIISSV